MGKKFSKFERQLRMENFERQERNFLGGESNFSGSGKEENS